MMLTVLLSVWVNSIVVSLGSRLKTSLLFIVPLYCTVLDFLFICYMQCFSIYECVSLELVVEYVT